MPYTVRQWRWGGNPRGGRGLLPPGVKVLLYANGAVFVLQLFMYSPLVRSFGLTPAMVSHGAFWQPFTYMFLHGGFFHILFNMFALWMFGRDIEYDWGTRAFVKYYLICGVGAGIVTVIALFGQTIPTIGASGAIFGILLAFGMMYPNRIIYLWFFLPIKAKYFVMIFGALEFFASMQGSSDGIGHYTHLGGLLVGFLYIKLSGRGMKFSIPNPFGFFGRWRARKKGRVLRRKWDEHRELMESVDRVLDRINEVGYDQLTGEEKETLDRASNRLSHHPENR